MPQRSYPEESSNWDKCLAIIHSYSMYAQEHALLQHLQQMRSAGGGTMVCVFHLHQPLELTFDEAAKDICLQPPPKAAAVMQQQGQQKEQQQGQASQVSLRRYLEVMFLEPKCTVKLQVGGAGVGVHCVCDFETSFRSWRQGSELSVPSEAACAVQRVLVAAGLCR